MPLPTHILLFITKRLLAAKRVVITKQNPETPTSVGVRRELTAWNTLWPWARTPSEPQRECGQANWGDLFCFILYLLGLFFIEKPSGLWTINHLSQRRILPFFPYLSSFRTLTPKHLKSSTVVFPLFEFSSHIRKSGKVPEKSHNYLNDIIIFLNLRFCEWVLISRSQLSFQTQLSGKRIRYLNKNKGVTCVLCF